MQIKQINGYIAGCEARGIKRDANLIMMMEEGLQVGDYVMISMGNVISQIDELEALRAWELYDEIFAAIDSPTSPPS